MIVRACDSSDRAAIGAARVCARLAHWLTLRWAVCSSSCGLRRASLRPVRIACIGPSRLARKSELDASATRYDASKAFPL